MSFVHTLSRNGSRVTVVLSGNVTLAEGTAFRAVIDAVLAEKPSALTVDLSEVEMVDSAGLSLFVLLRDPLARAGASITLQHPSAAVARILDVVGFNKLFSIVR